MTKAKIQHFFEFIVSWLKDIENKRRCDGKKTKTKNVKEKNLTKFKHESLYCFISLGDDVKFKWSVEVIEKN